MSFILTATLSDDGKSDNIDSPMHEHVIDQRHWACFCLSSNFAAQIQVDTFISSFLAQFEGNKLQRVL